MIYWLYFNWRLSDNLFIQNLWPDLQSIQELRLADDRFWMNKVDFSNDYVDLYLLFVSFSLMRRLKLYCCSVIYYFWNVRKVSSWTVTTNLTNSDLEHSTRYLNRARATRRGRKTSRKQFIPLASHLTKTNKWATKRSILNNTP